MQTHQKVFWAIFLGFVAVMVVLIMSIDQTEVEPTESAFVEEPLMVESQPSDTVEAAEAEPAPWSRSEPQVAEEKPQPPESTGNGTNPEAPKRLPPEGPRQPTWDPAALQRVIHEHNAAIQDCYQQELKRQPSLRGRVIVRITIHPDGYVREVELVGTSLRDATVIECILGKIRQWSDFDPVVPDQGEITIRQSYRFGL